MTRRKWTVSQVKALGVQTDVPTAASVLGIGRTAGYELVRRGQFPVPTLRLGSRIVVPVLPLLELIGAGATRESEALNKSGSPS